ncbi:hypothetical protein F5B20DRAFT_519233, partial [Whalleya microplaca]
MFCSRIYYSPHHSTIVLIILAFRLSFTSIISKLVGTMVDRSGTDSFGVKTPESLLDDFLGSHYCPASYLFVRLLKELSPFLPMYHLPRPLTITL